MFFAHVTLKIHFLYMPKIHDFVHAQICTFGPHKPDQLATGIKMGTLDMYKAMSDGA